MTHEKGDHNCNMCVDVEQTKELSIESCMLSILIEESKKRKETRPAPSDNTKTLNTYTCM